MSARRISSEALHVATSFRSSSGSGFRVDRQMPNRLQITGQSSSTKSLKNTSHDSSRSLDDPESCFRSSLDTNPWEDLWAWPWPWPPRSAPGRLLSGEHTHSHHITMMHFITSPWWLHPFTIFHGCRDSGCNKRRVAFNELPRNGWPACTLQESRVVSIHPLDVPDPPKLSMSFAHKTHRSDHPSAHCSPLFYVYYMSTA